MRATQSVKETTARRAATPRTSEKSNRGSLNPRSVLLALFALILGMGIGALVMRNRYKSSDIVLAVNGAIIGKEQVYRALERASGARVIPQMVEEELRLQYAQKMGVLPSPQKVEEAYARVSKQPNFDKILVNSNTTPDELKRTIRVGLAQSAVITRGVTISPEEIRKYYQTNVDRKNLSARFYSPETARIAVIVTRTQADADKAVSAINAGMSFGTAAKQYSLDASKASGGVMPLVLRGRTAAARVPGLEDIVFRLKVGERVGPRAFSGAWWIIQCLDKTPEVTRSFEEVKADCEEGALRAKGEALNGRKVGEEFQKFVKESKIQSFWPQFQLNIGQR